MKSTFSISVIGLGYVGLPLALELAKKYPVVGFDINTDKIKAYKQCIDLTNEVGNEALKKTKALFTSDEQLLQTCNFHIITVPTPINNDNTPNLNPVIFACQTIGKYLKAGDIIVFESTVYPGTTEEICIPILERTSGLTFNKDFKVGYSPERINPGDKVHTLTNITKIISGSDETALQIIDEVYSSIIEVGTYKAPTIKVAEAAKIIENAQRDINIAFMNELSIVFNKMDIDTTEVLKAASTKWNFLNFTPGLVGGHCISVDPYYFTYKAEQLGYTSQIIAAGRKINNSMGSYIAKNIVKRLIKAKNFSSTSKIGILGFTFKENCPDCRNTKVIDIVQELQDYGFETVVHDPLADPEEVQKNYNLQLVDKDELKDLDTLVIAVPHNIFKTEYTFTNIKAMLKPGCNLIFDLKSLYDLTEVSSNNFNVWRL